MTYTFLPEPNIFHIATLVCVEPHKKIVVCITPVWHMSPPPIYPQLPHLHNHGLFMLACITPVWNMHPPPIYWSHLKRCFWRSDFLFKYHQNPQVLKTWSKEKKKKKREEEKEKLHESLQKKRKLIFWEEKNNSTSKILFNVIPFSPPPSYHFKNPFQNHRESFLNSFWTIF
jgi:hypothetical protein